MMIMVAVDARKLERESPHALCLRSYVSTFWGSPYDVYDD